MQDFYRADSPARTGFPSYHNCSAVAEKGRILRFAAVWSSRPTRSLLEAEKDVMQPITSNLAADGDCAPVPASVSWQLGEVPGRR